MSGAGCRNSRSCRQALIHQPWSATPLELKGAGVELGRTYPEPIVDHRAGRERALAAYARTRAVERGRRPLYTLAESGYRYVFDNTGG